MREKEEERGVVELALYYDPDAPYQEELGRIRGRCSALQEEGLASVFEFDVRGFPSSEQKLVENKIRDLIPQQRGSIVATRGFPLPLSNSKKLNLRNTPILLVSSTTKLNGELVYVFPCLVGEKYYGVIDGLRHLRDNLPKMAPLDAISENELTESLLKNITLREVLLLKGREVETSAGLADLVFVDKEGRHVVVEVEREASDKALGQILRLSSAYEKKHGLQRDRVRAVIACIRIHEFVKSAAKRADVEIWLLPLV